MVTSLRSMERSFTVLTAMKPTPRASAGKDRKRFEARPPSRQGVVRQFPASDPVPQRSREADSA